VLAPARLPATAQALAEPDAHHQRNLAVFELAVERAATPPTGRPEFDNIEPETVWWQGP